MLRIAICDDEQFYREKIRMLLEQYFEKSDFLKACENRVKYDIVFMDISMEELDGMQTAQQIRAFHSDTEIVFVTADRKSVV